MKSNKDVITKEKSTSKEGKILKSINKLKKDTDMSINTLTVVKRKGSIVPFNKERIENALKAAFIDTKNLPKDKPLPLSIENTIKRLATIVEDKSKHLGEKGVTLTVEGIQDLVEITLMKNDFHDVARDYIIYRDHQRELRAKEAKHITILSADGITKRRFNPMKLSSSLESLFRNHHELEGQTNESFISSINHVTMHITNYVFEIEQETITRDALEEIIENSLMALGFYEEAKMYIRSRNQMAQEKKQELPGKSFLITGEKGTSYTISESDIEKQLSHATRDIENVDVKELSKSALLNFYEGITEVEVDTALIMAARSKIEIEPNYTFVSSKLLLEKIYRETLECSSREKSFETSYR